MTNHRMATGNAKDATTLKAAMIDWMQSSIDADRGRLLWWTNRAGEDPIYAAETGEEAVTRKFRIDWLSMAVKLAHAPIASPQSGEWTFADHVERLRDDVLRGSLECNSTCGFRRAVGAVKMDAARELLRDYGSFPAKIAAATKDGGE